MSKHNAFAHPYSLTWVEWYFRELGTTMIVVNIPHCWVLVRKGLKVRSFLPKGLTTKTQTLPLHRIHGFSPPNSVNRSGDKHKTNIDTAETVRTLSKTDTSSDIGFERGGSHGADDQQTRNPATRIWNRLGKPATDALQQPASLANASFDGDNGNGGSTTFDRSNITSTFNTIPNRPGKKETPFRSTSSEVESHQPLETRQDVDHRVETARAALIVSSDDNNSGKGDSFCDRIVVDGDGVGGSRKIGSVGTGGLGILSPGDVDLNHNVGIDHDREARVHQADGLEIPTSITPEMLQRM